MTFCAQLPDNTTDLCAKPKQYFWNDDETHLRLKWLLLSCDQKHVFSSFQHAWWLIFNQYPALWTDLSPLLAGVPFFHHTPLFESFPYFFKHHICHSFWTSLKFCFEVLTDRVVALLFWRSPWLFFLKNNLLQYLKISEGTFTPNAQRKTFPIHF